MNRSIKIYLFLFLFLNQTLLTAQDSDWINDSLPFYKEKVEDAILEKDFEAVIAFNKSIAKEGSKSLNPKVYNYFYEQKTVKAYQEQPEVLARVYNNIGNLEFYRSDYNAAKSAFNQASTLYGQAGIKREAAGMAMNLAILLEKSSKYDSAIINYRKAASVFGELQDTSSMASTLENIAIALYLKGSYDSALVYLNRTDSILSLNTPLNAERWVSVFYNNGIIYSAMGIYDKALDFTLKGLRLSEQLKNERIINSGYTHMIDIFKNMKDTINLKKYVISARDFAEQSGNKSTLASLDFSMGYLYLYQSNYDSAYFYAKRGLSSAKEANSDRTLRDGYVMMGNINYRQKDFLGTIKNLETAMNDFPSSRITELSGMYHNLGSAYMELGNFNKSNEYLDKSLALGLEINDRERLREAYETLSINSKKQENYKNAYDYYLLYKQYEDSIFNETKAKQIAEVQTKYETEKKDQAIAGLEQDREIQDLKSEQQQGQLYLSLGGIVLFLIVAFIFFYRARLKQKANTALAAKNNEIEEQNREKEMLLKEIHHRVKNNLQIISSLLSMQTRTLSDSKTINAMKESQSRVKTMALIHEKLYQYDNLARINMNDYMRQLSDFLSQTYHSEKDIKVVIESEDISLDIDTAVPLGLITNELLSNALKYAFEDMDKGQISIKLLKDVAGNYTLTVSDTGKGLAKDIDIENSKSLGLKLVRTLTRQINGNLSISSNPGATFSIVFNENQLAA